MSQVYGDGTDSTIGTQFNTFQWKRKALIETAEAEYFGPLGDSETLSKNFGQKLKKYHYLPLLDDRNINDQGLDASGVAVLKEVTITVTGTLVGTLTTPVVLAGSTYSAQGTGATDGAALTSAENAMIAKWGVMGYNISSGVYATIKAIVVADGGAGNMAVVEAAATTSVPTLYASSKNPGTIQSKLPALSETGGRVNRVGFKRLEIEGNISNYGFFYEWSKDSMDFDTDKDLYMHVNRENVRGAREISEDLVQLDLLSAAGVVKYTGDATTMGSTGYNATAALNSVITYDDLVKLEVTLNENKCPKDTKVISGSMDTDVKNIKSARYIFIGTEIIPTLMAMKDYHNNPAFVDVKDYAKMKDGKYMNALHGEIGAISGWRFVVVPEMMVYEGMGEIVASGGEDYLNDGVNYNVYPMVAVGSGSFAHIRFQASGGKADKFKIIVRKPGTFANPSDPYEKIGYSSIQFWQGTLILRPEWIAKVFTLAQG